MTSSMFFLRTAAFLLFVSSGVDFVDEIHTDPWWWTALTGCAVLGWFTVAFGRVEP